MPRYLALDYAFEAIKEHQNFLSIFLLALPTSLAAHSNAERDYDHSYKLPWLQVKGKTPISTLTDCAAIQESLGKIVPSSLERGLETISEETIHFGSVEDDIVPSSNPNSPPLDYQTKLSIQTELKVKDPRQTPSSLDGHPVKVQEGDLDCGCSGTEYARFMLENLLDVTSDSRQHQTCKEMCKHLVPKTIKDPFANLPPEQTAEDLRLETNEKKDFTTEPLAELELNKDLEKFPDVWKDQQSNEEKLLLPELVSAAPIPNNHSSMHDVMPDYCLRMEENSYTEKFDWSKTEFLGLQSPTSGSHQEQLPCISQSDGDPIQLNCEGIGPMENKELSDIPQRSLETPRTPVDVSKSSEDPGLDKEKLPITPISCFDTEIVTPKTKETAEKRIWKTEQHLHEAVALSLKVPEVKNMDKPNVMLSPKSELGLTKEHGNSDVDLQVPWQPVIMSKVMMNKKLTRTVEGLEGADEIKILDSKMESCQEAVMKEDLPIDDGEFDITLEPLEVGLKASSQKPRSSESEHQSENCKEHMTTVLDTSVNETEVKHKPLTEESKEKKEDSAPKRPSPVGDPLMDFLKLRCKESLIRKEQHVPIQQPPLPPPLLPVADKNSKELPSKSTNDTKTASKPVVIKKEIIDEDDSNESELTPTKSGNKKSKSRMVEVALTAPFVEMIKVLEDALTPVVNHLHTLKALSPSYTLHTLTPDVSRFLLIQYEKQNKSKDKEDTVKYQQIILLHIYVTAIDLMIHCDAVSAIMHLALANERYKDTLKGYLDGVRNTLFKKHCLLPKHTLHPKLHEMARLTGEWFLKKLKKEGKDHDPKVLVIIKREYTKLVESVTTVLLSVRGLSAGTLSSTPQTIYMAVSQALDKHNCLVISPAQIDESFPWAHFSLVIEYEAYLNSPWKELCLRQNIRHIELRCISSVGVGADLGHLRSTDGDDKKADDKSKQIPLKLIGSDNVINSSKLLHTLETRFNILIVERTSASHNSSSSQPICADLVVDERTGAIIVGLESLLIEGAVEPLVHRITVLSQQFCMLWVILEGNGHNNRYALGGHVVANTSKLQAALSQFTAKSYDFEVKVMYSNDSTSTASTISMICDVCQKASTAVWHQDDWLNRPWLTDRLSKHERFLSSFPCVNSFTAQVMLTAAPLPVLLKAPLTYLSKLCPWIPKRIVSNFYKLVHDESPFCDRPSKAPMSQRREETRDARTEANLQDRTIANQGSGKVIADEGATRGQKDTRPSDLHLQQHGGSKKWSMLQSECKTQSRDDLRQSYQDVPVKIKSEPVDDSPVYDFDDEALYPLEPSIPDDLKTPLELLASSDRIGKDQLSSSRYHPEAFDPEDVMDNGVNPNSTRDRLGHFSNDRSGRRKLSDLLPYSSTSKHDNTTVLSRESILEEATLQGLHSSIRARARKAYSYVDDLLPRQHQDNWCQEWDAQQCLANTDVNRDYSRKDHIRSSGQSAIMPNYGRNTGLYDMDPFPTRGTLKQAQRKYIGIAQPCPRAGKDCSTKKANPSNYTTTSRSGEFGTLATAGLPARRGSASTESMNQSQGNHSMQRHSLEYPSQHYQRPDDHQQAERLQSTHSRIDYRGMDIAMLQRKEVIQGQQASSYQYQRGDGFPNDIGQLNSEDMYTDGTTKRRRLTIEIVPGSKGGQTRLAFR